MSKSQEQQTMPVIVYFLALAVFALTTSEFMVAGMMPSLAQALNVSVPEVGYLISYYAAGMVIGGPVLMLALLNVPRKRALLVLIGVYTIGQSVAAAATTYE
ncbi:MAG: MFS transporter, partial [Advenella sp.]